MSKSRWWHLSHPGARLEHIPPRGMAHPFHVRRGYPANAPPAPLPRALRYPSCEKSEQKALRKGLKIPWPRGCPGSNPGAGTREIRGETISYGAGISGPRATQTVARSCIRLVSAFPGGAAQGAAAPGCSVPRTDPGLPARGRALQRRPALVLRQSRSRHAKRCASPRRALAGRMLAIAATKPKAASISRREDSSRPTGV